MDNFYLPVIDKDDEYRGLDGITVIAWSLFEQCSSDMYVGHLNDGDDVQ